MVKKRGSWTKFESAVGAIDGTSTEIYRPQIEPQELYFSGHRHFHEDYDKMGRISATSYTT
jgi:hypothetical protein